MIKFLKQMNTKHRVLGLVLATSSILYGCSKAELTTDSQQEKSRRPNNIGVMSAGDGENDLLGYGYDVTGEYGNSSASKFSVIDVARLKLDEPTRVEWDLSSKKYGEVIAGENAVMYLQSLTNKLGANVTVANPDSADTGTNKVPLFKGSISNTFDDSTFFSAKYVYSSYAMVIQQKRVKMNATNSLLMQYLTPSFVSDVLNNTPQYIVSQYGTHILKDIILGAKLDIKFRAETSKSDRKDAATKGIEFNILGIFGFNTSSGSNTQNVAENFSQKIVYRTIGGEPSASLIGNIPIGSTLPNISTAAWENTSSLNNAEMIDIAENGLIPIWDLIADPIKSAAVKAYVTQYLIDRELKLTYERQNVYEYFSMIGKDHFFTTDRSLDGNSYWAYQGIKFKALMIEAPGAVPAYSYYSTIGTDHAIMIDKTPALFDPSYWNVGGGIAFYVYTTQKPGTIPVYTYYHAVDTSHLLAADQALINYLDNTPGWRKDGILFYAYPAN